MNSDAWILQINSTINRKIEVLKDVIDFNTSKKICLTLFKQKFKNDLDNNSSHISLLTNDIVGYLNEYNAIMNGCVPKFYNTFRRLYKNKTKNKKDIILFFLKIMKGNEYTELNILWGLLYPHERHEFIVLSRKSLET